MFLFPTVFPILQTIPLKLTLSLCSDRHHISIRIPNLYHGNQRKMMELGRGWKTRITGPLTLPDCQTAMNRPSPTPIDGLAGSLYVLDCECEVTSGNP